MFLKNLKIVLIGMASVLLLISFVGCSEEESSPTPAASNEPEASVSSPPSTQMSLPVSLTTSQPATTVLVNAASNGGTTCDFGNENDPFENGYTMTKFLVNMAQSQSCFVDFLIEVVTTDASGWINQGVVEIGDGANDDPTHFEITQSTDMKTIEIWLFFDGTGTNADLYLTWTVTSDTDFTGQMVWLVDAANGGPDAVRTDFSRSASVDSNEVFIRFPNTSTDGIGGFRVIVSRTLSNGVYTYEAKGLMTMTDQWGGDSLPQTEDFGTPSLSMVAVADDTGLGASIAEFQNIGLHLGSPDSDPNDGVDDSFNLGSYSQNLIDKTYFDATGATEWSYKGVSSGSYVNNSGNNTRSGLYLSLFIDCFESATGCDFDDPPDGVNEVMDLGVGYFTDICSETDGADCTDFIVGIHNLGFMGFTVNPDTAEPSGDFRYDALGTATQITSVWPTDETSTSTFSIP